MRSSTLAWLAVLDNDCSTSWVLPTPATIGQQSTATSTNSDKHRHHPRSHTNPINNPNSITYSASMSLSCGRRYMKSIHSVTALEARPAYGLRRIESSIPLSSATEHEQLSQSPFGDRGRMSTLDVHLSCEESRPSPLSIANRLLQRRVQNCRGVLEEQWSLGPRTTHWKMHPFFGAFEA